MSIHVDRKQQASPVVERMKSELHARIAPWVKKTVPKVAEFAGLTFGHLLDRESTSVAPPDVLILGAERLVDIQGPYILAINGPARLLEDNLVSHVVGQTTKETVVHLTDTSSPGESKSRRHVRNLIIDPFMAGIRRRYQINTSSSLEGLQTASPIIMHLETGVDNDFGTVQLNSRIPELAIARNIPIVPIYIDRRNQDQTSSFVSKTYISFGKPILPSSLQTERLVGKVADEIVWLRNAVTSHIMYSRSIARVLDEVAADKRLLKVDHLSVEEASNLQIPDDELDKIQQVYFRELWIQELIRTLNERFDQLFGLKEEPEEDSAHHSPAELQTTMLKLIQMTDTTYGPVTL